MAEARSNVATIQNISIQKKSVEIAKKVLEIEQLRDYQLEALLGSFSFHFIHFKIFIQV